MERERERERSLRGWRDWGTLHLDHSHELICELGIGIMRGCLRHEPWSCPMTNDLFSRAPSLVKSLKDAKIFKSLGPSLGVNQMWTKRSDHAQKNDCVFSIQKKDAREGVWRTIFYFIFSPLCLPFPLLPPFSPLICNNIMHQKKGFKYIKWEYLCHDPLISAAREPLLPLSPQNSLNHDSG